MKYVIILIYAFSIIVYGYSVHMTSVEPDNKLWGYICAFLFVIVAIWSVKLYVEYSKKNEKDTDISQ